MKDDDFEKNKNLKAYFYIGTLFLTVLILRQYLKNFDFLFKPHYNHYG